MASELHHTAPALSSAAFCALLRQTERRLGLPLLGSFLSRSVLVSRFPMCVCVCVCARGVLSQWCGWGDVRSVWLPHVHTCECACVCAMRLLLAALLGQQVTTPNQPLCCYVYRPMPARVRAGMCVCRRVRVLMYLPSKSTKAKDNESLRQPSRQSYAPLLTQ